MDVSAAGGRYRRSMTAFGSIPARARVFSWQAVDCAAAVLLTSMAAVEAASAPHLKGAAVIVAVVFASTVGWCRRAPTAAVCVALLSAAAMVAIGAVDLPIAPLVTVILYFTLGRQSAAARRPVTGVLLVALAVPVVVGSPGASHVNDVVSVSLFFVAAPFGAGWWVARGTVLTSELRRNVDELAHRQRDRALQAACEERARVARELHDVVAHNVSVMVVQLQAARRVAPADLAAAGTALQAVSDCGRDALVDMRRMIGVLHRDDLELAAPGLAQLPALVERAEASGVRVTLEVRGTPRSLPPSVELTSYRLAQEALTNVIKHAAATTASIAVTYAPEAVELEVCDDGRGPGLDDRVGYTGGQGLIGMRERLALYGGELHVGARPSGGFRVRARIPIDAGWPA